MTQRSPTSTLFPYTTLFRSALGDRSAIAIDGGRGEVGLAAEDDHGVVADAADRWPGVGGAHHLGPQGRVAGTVPDVDRKSTRLNSSHTVISYAVFCLKKKNI